MYRRNRSAISYQLSAIGLTLLLFSSSVHAEEPKVKEPIVVNGDKVEYFHETKQVVGSGNVSITYKDVVMTCDKIIVYLDTREAIAEGGVKITQRGAYFTGERMNYNFDTRKGAIINGYVNSKPFYGKAEEMDKVGEEQINLKRGYVTTCDLENPHYRVQAREVRIYLEDKIIAKHILFFFKNVPIAYFPYYLQPIKERSAHVTLQVGRSEEWGYWALSSYRYYFSDIAKGRYLLDYRTKKGLAGGVENYHSTRELGSGSAKFYYTSENDSAAFEPSGEVESKYHIQVRHKWEVTEDTVATLEFNKLRDRNFIKDYFYKEYEELGDPDNYISFITSKGNYTTSLLIRKRMDKYFNVVERLPEFRIDIPDYKIVKNAPIYYRAEASGAYLNETFTKTVPDEKDLNAVRFDAYNQLSYASKIFKALSLRPYIGTRQTFYSRNKWGDTNLVRGIFNAGLDSSVKFYRTYDVETSFLGLDIHRLRHIITPTANYYYTHQPTISPNNLNQFDGIDSLDTENGVKLALENKLQTKRPQGGNGALKSVDIATFIVSSDYAFRLEKSGVDYKSQKFKNVDLQLEISPYPWFYSLSRMTINTKKYEIQAASVDLTTGGKSSQARDEDYSLTMGYRYENIETGKTNFLTLDALGKITDKWKARAYERFDVETGSVVEQEYTLYRDLHCWLAEFTYNVKTNPADHTFWFVLRLKAFPDFPIGFRRTYYRPRFGSVGA